MKTVLPNRGVLAITGEDRVAFLQGLVTNDVTKVTATEAIYACLLSPQGRFLHDFFIIADGERLLLECEADRRDDLAKRLRMFRLRAKVEIVDETPLFVVGAVFQTGDRPIVPEDMICFADPRHPALGWRILALVPETLEKDVGAYEAYDRMRITMAVPDGSRDMAPGEALPMDYGLDILHAIAWDKGCYIGQELTARMHYKAQPKKRLLPVRIEGAPVEPGTILTQDGVEAGEMRSSCGDLGLALMRMDIETDKIISDSSVLRLDMNVSV
jgi:folate-binding protein YgfZ